MRGAAQRCGGVVGRDTCQHSGGEPSGGRPQSDIDNVDRHTPATDHEMRRSLPQPRSNRGVEGGDAQYMSLVERFFNDIGGSHLYNIITQYPGTASMASAPELELRPSNSLTFGGSYIETRAFPQLLRVHPRRGDHLRRAWRVLRVRVRRVSRRLRADGQRWAGVPQRRAAGSNAQHHRHELFEAVTDPFHSALEPTRPSPLLKHS